MQEFHHNTIVSGVENEINSSENEWKDTMGKKENTHEKEREHTRERKREIIRKEILDRYLKKKRNKIFDKRKNSVSFCFLKIGW